eukprot:COSAG01_NODE_14410_length_1457_cov_9.980118_1_plen_83_part_00
MLRCAVCGVPAVPPPLLLLLPARFRVLRKTMLTSMAVLTEKTFTIQVCRDTIDKLETAKKIVSATNKAARCALMGDPTAALG